ncbi:MAG: hypothetical protein ABIN74_03390 [Ferruginibacter sp.]
MKKVISIVTVFVFAVIFNVSAQVTNNTPGGATGYMKIVLEDVVITGVKANDGANTVPVPGNRGKVIFTRRGNTFTNVIYTDAAGKSVRLQPNNGTANGLPKPGCKYPLPDACFGTADKNVGMCICKPTDLSNGDETYTIGLLLPAVQKIREAAARMK